LEWSLAKHYFPAFFFRGIEEMRIITIINVLAKVIFTVSVFIIIKHPEDYHYVPILNGLGFILSGCFGFILSLKYVSFMKPIFNEVMSIAKESFSLFLSNLAVSFYTNINTLLVGVFISDSIAGVYSSMEKLIVATKSIYMPLYQALFP
jgi:PST family polysaccharide transporter